jgi:hypothetical protein
MEKPRQSQFSRADTIQGQITGDANDRRDSPREEAVSGSRTNWKKVLISRLKDFLIAREE